MPASGLRRLESRATAQPARSATASKRSALTLPTLLARGHRPPSCWPPSGIRPRGGRSARLRSGHCCSAQLHRQLRPAEARDLRRRQGGRPDRLRGALGQPQLRGARASGDAHELPRLPAAGGGVRARRHARHRSDQRAARHRQGRQAGAASPTSGRATPRCRSCSLRSIDSQMFRDSYASVFQGDEQLGRHPGAGRASAMPGMRSRPTSRTRRTSRA